MNLSVEEEENLLRSDPWVDEVFANLIGDELVTLDDFIPPMFVPARIIKKRNLWIKDNNKKDIILYNKEYHLNLFRLEYEPTQRTIFIMELMLEFVEAYPQYSDLIKDIDDFKRHLWNLKKELYGL